MKNHTYHLFYPIQDRLGLSGCSFFVRYGSEVFMVSTWHMFTGKDISTQNYLPLLNHSPKFFRCSLKYSSGKIEMKSYPLYNTDGNRLFITHNEINMSHDVAIMHVNQNKIPQNIISINDNLPNLLQNENVYFEGYPVVNNRQSIYPIYSEGFLVQPQLHDDFYIANINAGLGCSGAPVFCKSNNNLIGIISAQDKSFNDHKHSVIVKVEKMLQLILKY